MFSKLVNTGKGVIASVSAAFAMLMSGNVLAALPTPVAPSSAPADGNWLSFMEGWANDAGATAGLVIGMVIFIIVAWAMIAKFNEVRTGKAEWSDVGLTVIIGGVILVADIYFLAESAAVI